jgi:hypothetical protein
MTQEEFMDVMAIKRKGLSIKEIAQETAIPEHHQRRLLMAQTAYVEERHRRMYGLDGSARNQRPRFR